MSYFGISDAEGIPDNWGQAAVMSALVEGLAGVVDKGQQFQHVELSPRWPAAGKKDVSITVAYAPTGKYVSYRFRHQESERKMTLDVDGDAGEYTLRLMLPAGSDKVSARLNDESASGQVAHVESTADFVLTSVPGGSQRLEVTY